MQLFERNAPTLFTPERAEKEAARARKIENLYHVGQQKIWDGREVLREAFERFPAQPGQERIPRKEREALAKVFSMMMWGELAAWRVSLQLAEMLTDTEHRLAATGQAHDEARHYYVLHDYLKLLEVDVPPLDPYSRVFLNACLEAPLPIQKIVGMQMLVETIALTMFKMVREMNVDPALSYMLTFYEQDEARHVGFGAQAAPALVLAAGVTGRARLLAFEVKVLSAMLMALKSVEAELRLLGADPRALLEEGASRFAGIVADYKVEAGSTSAEGQALTRLFEAVMEGVFPRAADADWSSRAQAAFSVLWRKSELR
jgi:hypothetical protein